jgi:hypothetical protein
MHINVEICNTVQAIKYLFKYVYKGHDRASVSIENISVMSPTIVSTEPPNIDNIASTTTYEVSRPVNEIKKYVDVNTNVRVNDKTTTGIKFLQLVE